MAKAAGPENIKLPVCLVCDNKPPSRTVRLTFGCGHTYHWACHDGKYNVTTKSSDKGCAKCRGMQAAETDGQDGKGQRTPAKEERPAKRPRKAASPGSAEAGPSQQARSPSGCNTSGGSPKGVEGGGGGVPGATAAEKKSAKEDGTGKRKAEEQGDPKSKGKRACKPAAH